MNKRHSLFHAFANAFNGLSYFFRNDRNGKIHLLSAVVVIVSGFVLGATPAEWITLLLCATFVIALEMINAAIERLSDVVHKDFHPAIKNIKDVSAAAVLIASIASAVIGFTIFIPKIIALL